MSVTIKILSEKLANQIAAGEVVERPASVVKELVENALDAGGSNITVEIEAGGKRLIRVTDDGCGMSREDALLSLERHATSKIVADGDLFTLRSLGFRGEALPSIASVSRLTLETRTADTIEGTEIYAEGGRIREVKACGMAAGTIVTVRNLFFNTPARLKFLRSSETEAGHVGELLTRLALSRPAVRFTAISDGKVSFSVGNGGLRERVGVLLGRQIADGLFPVMFSEGSCSVSGLVGKPETNRSTAGCIYTYINGRFIRDRVVQHAVLQAYRTLLERGRYPVVVIAIDLPPSEVDVNVHPTKHEVRFRRQGEIHDIIQRSVESVLRVTPWAKGGALPPTVQWEKSGACDERSGEPDALAVVSDPTSHHPSVSEACRETVREALSVYRPVCEPSQKPLFHTSFSSDHPSVSKAEASFSPDTQSSEVLHGFFSSLDVIGQFHGAYVLCQDGENLVIIDQHAAHERVMFEKLRIQFDAGKVVSQGLLFPEPIEMSFGEAAAIREHLSDLERFGFDLEHFGGSTWLLKQVPCLVSEDGYVSILRDIVEELRGVGRSRGVSECAEKVLTTIACHSVVRGKRLLAPQEIAALFVQMDEADFATNCPHGRPVYKIVSLGQIEKMFKR